IATYRRLLTSPHKLSLGSQQLMESAAFLAHAYTQNGSLDEAELTLGLLSSFNPDYWLVHYLETCLCSRRYELTPQGEYLDRGLDALERAIDRDTHGQARSEAAHDPDLKTLRNLRKAEFAKLLKKENKHS
ncbi:MAG: hypothetical protein ACAI44_32785, partial [Candidatus Sericytochromatia bacterium]